MQAGREEGAQLLAVSLQVLRELPRIACPVRALDGNDGWGDRFAIGWQAGEELGHGAPGAGIAQVGRDFMERNQDKGALGKARVGDFQGGFAEDQVAIEEDVEVESARAVGKAGDAVAAEFALEGKKSAEELKRAEIGFKGNDSVEKPGLIGETDGRSGIER